MPPDDRTVVESTFHVRYAETDAMGVVHHAAYFVYFEEGRSEYMRQHGSSYADIEAGGNFLPVTEAGARFVGSLRYGMRATVRTWIEELRSRRLTFSYEVVDAASGQLVGTGFTRHVWVNKQGQVTTMPDRWRELLGGVSKQK